jgi:hypothetical protein
MSIYDFRDYIHDLLERILVSQGVTVTPHNIYRPLKPFPFSRYSPRWFPDPTKRTPSTVMPQDIYDEIRAKLAFARDSEGDICLSYEDIAALDIAWTQYLSDSQTKHIRTGEKEPKRFIQLLQAFETFECRDSFMTLLYEAVYRPMLRGEHKTSYKNLTTITSAFSNKSEPFSGNPTVLNAQRDLLVVCGGFCLMRMSHPDEVRYMQWMKDIRKREPLNQIILSGIHQHAHFALGDEATAREFMAAPQVSWGQHFGSITTFVRAASVALNTGWGLDDAPDYLQGKTVRGAINDARSEMATRGRYVEAEICGLSLLEGLAKAGDIDSVLTELTHLSNKSHLLPDRSPHLESYLFQIEAEVFFVASKGNDVSSLTAAGNAVREWKRIVRTHPGLRVGLPQRRLLKKIEHATLAKFGSIAHLGE